MPNDSPLPPRHLAPLDRRELRRERARAATRSGGRSLLALLVAGAAVHYWLDIPAGWILIGIAITLAIGWYLRFQSSSPRRRREISEDLIKRERHREDDRLATEMRSLADDGFDGYAITLGKFVQQKRAIESELARRGATESAHGQQLGVTVDSVCFGVAEQFRRIASLEKLLAALPGAGAGAGGEREVLAAERRELLCEVIDAYKTLKSTRQNLVSIIDPAAALTSLEPSTELGTIIDQLRHEEEIVRNTRKRLRRDGITNQP